VQVASHDCRDICDTFLTAKGFDQNYTMPDVIYIQWFIDTFEALKKLRSNSASASKSRVLAGESSIKPLLLGSTVDFDGSSLF